MLVLLGERTVKMLIYKPVPRVYALPWKDCEPRAIDYNRGFSVVEILIVLVILAIVAMVAIPVTSSAASMQLRSAANMIAADLEYAKSMAITRTQDYSVVFDCSNESYQIENSNGVIPHPVKKGFSYIVSLPAVGLNKVDIVSADFDSAGTVKFDYLGSPHNASGGPLNSGVIKLRAGTAIITVTVEPVTGFVSITN
jgi:prepilin-type N-terminal cleavage/methylation domain-containing protein